jgi:hypothetical protein
MHTNRSETRSISIQASPAKVLDLVGDANALPRWAPNFATSVRPENGHWLVDDELLIDLRVDRELGTVDILRPKLPPTGAYSRVVPNGEGSEYLFTLFFPDGTAEEAITKQMTVVEEELRTIRALCE